MDSSLIPYSHVPRSSQILLDYVSHFDRVSAFYGPTPFDLSSFQEVARQLIHSEARRRALADILSRQNKAFGSAEPTHANIQRLRDPQTFVVVTGQQVGLLSGPAFTIYKALTAVRLANFLSQQGLPCVPVFWLATEDHDLPEVAETRAFNQEYELVTLRDEGIRPAPQCSVGYAQLSSAISGELARLEQALPEGPQRTRTLEDLRECYQPGVKWGQAFGRLMGRWFSHLGVVLLDPLDEEVHTLAREVYRQALETAGRLRSLLLERSKALVQAGYHAQVHVGADSTLLFAQHQGNRLALHEHRGEFVLENQPSRSLTEMTAWLNLQPIDFTSSALFRPIVQDTLLPTIAMVAGPAELAYLSQSQALYSEFGRPAPAPLLRAGFTLLDQRVDKLLRKYQLSVRDAWQGEDHLNRVIARSAFGPDGAGGWSERLDGCENELGVLLGKVREDIERLDPTLLDAVKHAQDKMAFQLERLRSRISRAALERSGVLKRHEQELRRFLLPDDELQERQVSGAYFLGVAGYGLLEQLLDEIDFGSFIHRVTTM